MVITALATFAALEMNDVIPKSSHMDIFGLTTLAKPLAILLILGGKCLFTETIKLEAMQDRAT